MIIIILNDQYDIQLIQCKFFCLWLKLIWSWCTDQKHCNIKIGKKALTNLSALMFQTSLQSLSLWPWIINMKNEWYMLSIKKRLFLISTIEMMMMYWSKTWFYSNKKQYNHLYVSFGCSKIVPKIIIRPSNDQYMK